LAAQYIDYFKSKEAAGLKPRRGRFGVLTGRPVLEVTADPRPRPTKPTPHVQPKPGGGQSLPRLLLVKPDRTCNELLDGLCGLKPNRSTSNLPRNSCISNC